MEAGATRQQQANQDLSELAKTRSNTLWGEYVELKNQARHAETVGMNVGTSPLR
jgi:hypothetical protein